MSGLNVCPASTRWGSGLGKLAGVFSCYALCPLSWMLFVGHLPGWCQSRHHASLVPKRSRADSTEQDCCCLGPCKVFCWMVCQWGTWQLMLQVFCDIVWNSCIIVRLDFSQMICLWEAITSSSTWSLLPMGSRFGECLGNGCRAVLKQEVAVIFENCWHKPLPLSIFMHF